MLWFYPSPTQKVSGCPAVHRRDCLWLLAGESPDPSGALVIPTRIKNASTTAIWISSGSTHPSKAYVTGCWQRSVRTPNGGFSVSGGVQFWLMLTSSGNRAVHDAQCGNCTSREGHGGSSDGRFSRELLLRRGSSMWHYDIYEFCFFFNLTARRTTLFTAFHLCGNTAIIQPGVIVHFVLNAFKFFKPPPKKTKTKVHKVDNV